MSGILPQALVVLEAMTAWMLATSSAVADAAASIGLHNEALTLGSSILLAAFLGALVLSLGKKDQAKVFTSKRTKSSSLMDDLIEEDFRNMGMPQEPHLEGGFLPPTRLIHSNSLEAFDFDNENCSGQFLVLHRPTYDSKLDSSGNYRYGDYFAGKKRLWEIRFRFRFKRRVSLCDLFFGAELEAYVPVNAATKRVMDLSVSGMRQVVGDRLYHTLGEATGDGEREQPAILLPLWAFDQFLETLEGETPPELTDPNLPTYGHKRVGQLREYKRLMDALDLRPGPTFTFCFWGVSRFCDVMTWQATGIPIFTPIDLNLYCGKPPLHLVMYTLNGDDEKRHLQSRKTYFFRVCFWSSLKRPDKDVVMKVAGQSLDLLKRRRKHLSNLPKAASQGLSLFGLNVFQCCVNWESAPASCVSHLH